MKTGILTSAAFALALGITTGGAMAQTASAPLAVSAPPLTAPDHASRDIARWQRPLTVMGMTGGIEPKYPETTGSIVDRPVGTHRAR